MRIYLFVSQQDPRVLAFTWDETGSNLPIDLGPWKPSNSGSAVAAGVDAGPLVAVVKNFGYYITSERSIH